jgi:hypothetical protein
MKILTNLNHGLIEPKQTKKKMLSKPNIITIVEK